MAISTKITPEIAASKQQEWQDYVLHGIKSDQTRQEVLKSWERCKEYHLLVNQQRPLNMLDPAELAVRKEKNRILLDISEPIMETISNFIAGSGFIIALTDSDGVILRLMGDDEMADAVKGGGFVVGGDWSERSAGSNAIGTTLAIRKPIQFCGYEHFCTFTQRTACSAAPILSPNGRIIGSIDLTGRLRMVNDHTLGIAVSMASAIENCLRIYQAEQQSRMDSAFKNAVIESISDGIITTDSGGVITHMNHKAADYFGIRFDSKGKNLYELMKKDNQPLFDLLSSGENITDRELDIFTESGKRKFIATVRPIRDETGVKLGTVLNMSELSRARRIARRYAMSSAKLTFDDLLGDSSLFCDSVRAAKNAAHTNATILLLGESGTGKDVFAQAIHNESDRSHGPFVSINCGAIPRELIASELFGYVEGAFTGANRGGNPGKFELADGGTLFLDEIGEMPLDLQVHLLRVLEQKTVTRVGGQEEIPVDVRIIAATNKDLEKAAQEGHFRYDLYYRLNVIALRLPPLRERTQDIPLLTRHFYRQFRGSRDCFIPPDYQRFLMDYPWPGNIRELRNIIERTVSLSPNGELEVKYLPEKIRRPVRNRLSSHVSLNALEEDLLRDLLRTNHGNLTKSADELGIARTTLYRKIKKYGIDLADLREK